MKMVACAHCDWAEMMLNAESKQLAGLGYPDCTAAASWFSKLMAACKKVYQTRLVGIGLTEYLVMDLYPSMQLGRVKVGGPWMSLEI